MGGDNVSKRRPYKWYSLFLLILISLDIACIYIVEDTVGSMSTGFHYSSDSFRENGLDGFAKAARLDIYGVARNRNSQGFKNETGQHIILRDQDDKFEIWLIASGYEENLITTIYAFDLPGDEQYDWCHGIIGNRYKPVEFTAGGQRFQMYPTGVRDLSELIAHLRSGSTAADYAAS